MPIDDPTFDNYAAFVPQGWICSACKTVHTPFIAHCNCQQPKPPVLGKFRTLISNPFFTFSFEDIGEIPVFAN